MVVADEESIAPPVASGGYIQSVRTLTGGLRADSLRAPTVDQEVIAAITSTGAASADNPQGLAPLI